MLQKHLFDSSMEACNKKMDKLSTPSKTNLFILLVFNRHLSLVEDFCRVMAL